MNYCINCPHCELLMQFTVMDTFPTYAVCCYCGKEFDINKEKARECKCKQA